MREWLTSWRTDPDCASLHPGYACFDFDPSPIEPLHLFLLLKEVARLLKT